MPKIPESPRTRRAIMAKATAVRTGHAAEAAEADLEVLAANAEAFRAEADRLEAEVAAASVSKQQPSSSESPAVHQPPESQERSRNPSNVPKRRYTVTPAVRIASAANAAKGTAARDATPNVVRRLVERESIDRVIAELVEQAPPLTDSQRARLAVLLTPEPRECGTCGEPADAGGRIEHRPGTPCTADYRAI
jgi:hypothetical protein